MIKTDYLAKEEIKYLERKHCLPESDKMETKRNLEQ